MSTVEDFYRGLGVTSEETLHTLTQHSTMVHYQKGDVLVREGDPMKMVFFHLTEHAATAGICILEDGTEDVVGFGYGFGHPCLGANGLGDPIMNTVLALSEMDCLVLDLETLAELLQKDKDVWDIYHRLVVADHNWDSQTLTAFKTMQAEERYLWYLDFYAPVTDIIPLGYVASFLGIKQQSLSRIRRKLREEGKLKK